MVVRGVLSNVKVSIRVFYTKQKWFFKNVTILGEKKSISGQLTVPTVLKKCSLSDHKQLSTLYLPYTCTQWGISTTLFIVQDEMFSEVLELKLFILKVGRSQSRQLIGLPAGGESFVAIKLRQLSTKRVIKWWLNLFENLSPVLSCVHEGGGKQLWNRCDANWEEDAPLTTFVYISLLEIP